MMARAFGFNSTRTLRRSVGGAGDMNNADDLLDPPERAPMSGGERRCGSDVTTWPDSGMPLITLTVSYPLPAVCVIAVAGDLDAATVPFMDERVREVLAGDPVW